MKKILVIGAGNVGFTFVTIAQSRGLVADYVLVDLNQDLAEAHAHDFQDMAALMPHNGSTFRSGTFADSKDADIVVITASIPMRPGFTDRLSLAKENAKLMETFGSKLKDAGFKGIIIVAANPCDVMAACLHYSMDYPAEKIISTGTLLDSARLQKFVAQRLDINADSVKISMLGEHGASAIAAWTTARIGETPVLDLLKVGKLTEEDLDILHKKTVNEGFFILQRKGNTQFGIATAIYEIVDAILNNARRVMNVGVKLPEGYSNPGIYTSIPVVVDENGYHYLPMRPNFRAYEWEKFEKTTQHMANVHTETLAHINIDKKF